MRLVRDVLARTASEEGYTLIELMTVLGILLVVLGALVGAFVSGSRAEIDMNQRFRAQQDARLALSKLRREAHCAQLVTTGPLTQSRAFRVTLTPPATAVGGCSTVAATWCTQSLAANRFGLFRMQGTTCNATGVKVADHLTDSDGLADGVANVFSFAPRTYESLATLGVDFRVDVDVTDSRAAYRLVDRLALRRSGRCQTVGQSC